MGFQIQPFSIGLKRTLLPKVATTPNLTTPLHQKAIDEGFDHFTAWARNVIDEFKPLSNEEIIDKLKETAFPYAVLCENIIGDFNISTIIRNANAFNASKFYYVGNRKMDKRGAVCTYKYTIPHWIETMDEFEDISKEYKIIGIDNIPGSIPLDDYEWSFDPKSLVVFGEEGCGISPTMQKYCKDIVHINQYGSTRSINVGCASAIIMNDITTKFNKLYGSVENYKNLGH